MVELPSHSLPDDGSYFTFVQEIADGWRERWLLRGLI